MTLVNQTSCLAHRVQPNYELKLSPLELLRDRGPTLFQSQTNEFSRILLNHSTPYIYTTKGVGFLVKHCTPCTYTNSSAKLLLNLPTPYTYIKDCAICVINHRQGSPSKLLPHPRGCAKTRQNCATGGPPIHPTLQSHTQPSISHPPTPFINPFERGPSPKLRSTFGGKDSFLSDPLSYAKPLANSIVGAK
jgi:hypothetical protein